MYNLVIVLTEHKTVIINFNLSLFFWLLLCNSGVISNMKISCLYQPAIPLVLESHSFNWVTFQCFF